MARVSTDEVLKTMAPEYYTDEVLLKMTEQDKHYAASIGYGRQSTLKPASKKAVAKKAVAKKATAKKKVNK